MAGLGRRTHYRKHLTDAVLHDFPEPDENAGKRIARVVGTRGGNMFDVIISPCSHMIPSNDSKNMEAYGNNETTISNGESNESLEDTDQLKATSTSDNCEVPSFHVLQRSPQLAFLPTKFRKLVWIKRNDFVIVECGDNEGDEEKTLNRNEQYSPASGVGFRCVITHILYKDQVKHIKSKGLWPVDPFFNDDNALPVQQSLERENEVLDDEEYCDSDNDNKQRTQTQRDSDIVFVSDDFAINRNRLAAMRVDDASSDDSVAE